MRIPRGPATVIGEAGCHLYSATRFTPGKAGGPAVDPKARRPAWRCADGCLEERVMPADPISVRSLVSPTAWIRRPAPPTGGRRGSLIRCANERGVSEMQGKSRAREGTGPRAQARGSVRQRASFPRSERALAHGAEQAVPGALRYQPRGMTLATRRNRTDDAGVPT